MSEFDFWYNTNKHALDELYYKLIYISNSYSIIIIDNNKSYNNFLKMIYNESSKKVIDKKLYPEYFYKRYNNGYQKYKILNIK